MITGLEDAEAALRIAGMAAEIWAMLNTKRTVLIQLENHTPYALRVESHHHSHGGFAVPPDIEIPPHSVSLFGSQSKAGSLFTGTEGSVTYSTQGPTVYFTLSWNNPWAGSNACNASLDGERTAAFAITHICGSGNDALMKYELRQVRDPRFVRSPDYTFVRHEGYVLSPSLSWDPDSPPPFEVPIVGLYSYWSPGREDNQATTNLALLRSEKLDPD
jgi:hypothetical protein